VLLGDVEPTVLPVDAVGDLQALEHAVDPFGPAVAVAVDDGVDAVASRADENDAEGIGHRHGARARHPDVQFDLEPRRQLH